MQDSNANLRILAQNAMENGDYTGAAVYYRQILLNDPNDWEGMFYEVYCSMVDFSVASISNDANRLKMIFEKVYKKLLVDMALKKSKDPSFDMVAPMRRLSRDITNLLLAMKKSTMNYYYNFPETVADKEKRLFALRNASLGIADVYYSYDHKTMAANFYKLAQALNENCSIDNIAVNRIREVDPSFSLEKSPANPEGGNFFKFFFKWFGICFGIPFAIFLIYLLMNN